MTFSSSVFFSIAISTVSSWAVFLGFSKSVSSSFFSVARVGAAGVSSGLENEEKFLIVGCMFSKDSSNSDLSVCSSFSSFTSSFWALSVKVSLKASFSELLLVVASLFGNQLFTFLTLIPKRTMK